MQIKPATRQGVKPLIGLYGKSGGGKTMSALLLARGLVGPTGRITLIDTESGRGSLFADLIPGGYNVLEIGAPFAPEIYTEAIEAAEPQSDCIVVDSMTHLWDGDGGVLDMQEQELTRMAGDDYRKREACKMAAWIKPKMQYKKFIGKLLRLRCGLICCLRAQEKTHIVKDDGKSKVVTDEFSSPIFDHRFIFELLVNGEVVARDGVGGYVYWTKVTHPSVRDCLPSEKEQIGVKHGELLRKWCETPGKSPTATTTKAKDDPFKTLKGKLWKLMGEKPAEEMETQLVAWKIIAPGEKLAGMTIDELTVVLEKAELQLQPA
jgi:hypothetical protein